jgi:S1-C subfamily serine protease
MKFLKELLIIFTSALIGFLFVLGLVAFTKYMDTSNDYRKTIVKISGDGGHGSGSIIKISENERDAFILTNKHVCLGVTKTVEELNLVTELNRSLFLCQITQDKACIDDLNKRIADIFNEEKTIGKTVTIKFNNLEHKDIIGTVLRMSKKKDLCIVKIENDDFPVIKIAKEKAKLFDHVFSLGNPLDMTNHLTDGYVGDTMDYEGASYQLITSEIYPGSSGSPTVNDNGELVGVNTLKGEAPTQSYMIPLNDVLDFLEE